MGVSEVNRNRFITSQNRVFVLQDGQIVQGKIVKFFPNNHAEIQIGTNKLIAELAIPLKVGESYFFQVEQQLNELIHLKVLSNEHIRGTNSDASNLIKMLGFPPSKQMNNFLQQLINEKVPFDVDQLKNAIRLLDQKGYHVETMNVIKEMMLRRLPITNGVFQALYMTENFSLTSLMKEVLSELKLTSTLTEQQKNLYSLVEQLMVRPEKHSLVSDDVLKNLFTLSGARRMDEIIINRNFESSNNTLQFSKPFLDTLSKIVKKEPELITLANRILTSFPNLQTMSLTNEQFSSLKKIMMDQLLLQLPVSSKEYILPFLNQNTVNNQQQIFNILQSLTNKVTYQTGKEIVRNGHVSMNSSIQSQFLTYIHQFINTIGLTDEYILKNNVSEQQSHLHTIKSFLLQMVQETPSQTSEKVHSLLHFVNGMQIQSLQESNQMVIANLQLPGEKFALNKDLFMQFEGRKTPEGNLDPEFCRVLFILHLRNLEETIIDMNIQRRVISVTIFNDFSFISQDNNMNRLKQVLSENLHQMDYHLSSLSFKSLYEERKHEHLQFLTKESNLYKEGFDFRI